MSYPVPANEPNRLAAVRKLEILDSPPHADFENLVALAKSILNVPMVALSIIDENRQWFKARIGIELAETPRDAAFCAHTICSDRPLIIPDATLDLRFRGNPLVLNVPGVRFYAGTPLSTSAGLNIGTLCAIDTVPRFFNESEIAVLRQLGNMAEAILLKHRLAIENATNQKALADQVRLFEQACELAKMGAWQRDLKSNRITWTAAMYALHEMEQGADISLREHLGSYVSSDREALLSTIEEASRTNSSFKFEGRMYTAKGRKRWVRLISDLEMKDGVAVRRYGVKQDITEEKELQGRIHRLAQQDDLTGVMNRRGLIASLSEWAKTHHDGAFPIAFITFDLDGFKAINDSFGHAAGDACLLTVARRAKIALKGKGKIARTGGDEFSILRVGDCGEQSVEEFVLSLMAAVAKPIRWQGHTLSAQTSVGSSTRAAATPFDPDELVREADVALYEAKHAGRNCHRTYLPEYGQRLADKTQVLQQANEALRDKRFELYYQPKVDLREQRIAGLECLLRLNTIEKKVLSPGAFAAALEDPAVSRSIGNFVVEEALDQALRWTRQGLPFGSVAINLSASQFKEPKFAERLLNDIDKRGLPRSAVQAEVTEGVFLSASGEAVLEACRKLSDGGVRISFDDFGTGFASLTHLRDFPVDEIKIDRSFVADMSRPGNLAIVNAMVILGNSLSMKVVAEGVETEDQATMLRSLGCHCAQGYLYARPLPAVDAAEFISRSGDRLRACA